MRVLCGKCLHYLLSVVIVVVIFLMNGMGQEKDDEIDDDKVVQNVGDKLGDAESVQRSLQQDNVVAQQLAEAEEQEVGEKG